MRYTTRPLSDRTWLNPKGRTATRFKAKWTDTLELLDREVSMLRGRDLIIEVDVPERGIRLDGMLRADARAASPAVVVAFESKHGPLLYRCDRFVTQYYGQGEDWQHNVRAIALTLESLRAVDRYGATETGQQYAGWKAIGAAPHTGPTALGDAGAVLCELAGVPTESWLIPAERTRIISLARRNAHPDTGGSNAAWHRFSQALEAIVERGQS